MGKVQELYRTVFNQAQAPLLLIQQGVIYDANQQAGSLLGYTVDELTNRPITAVSAETQADGQPAAAAWMAIETAVLDANETTAHTPLVYRWQYQCADGAPLTVDLHLTPLAAADESLICATLKPALVEQERLVNVVQDTGNFVGIASPDGRALYVNPAGRELLEMEPEAKRDVFIIDYLGEGEEKRFEQMLSTVRSQGAWEGEIVFRTANGREFPALATITAHHDVTGQVDYLTTIARDISDLKETERAWRRSEERFRQVIQSAPLVVYTTDEEGVFTMSAGRSLAKLGLEPGQVVGLSAFEMYADFPEIVEALERAMEGESVFKPDIEVAGLHFDTHFAPLYDDEGEIAGVSGISVDVTEVVEAQQELTRLSNILESTTDFVSQADPDGNILYLNQAGREILGVSPEVSTADLKISDLQSAEVTDGLIDAALKTAMETGVWSGESYLLHQETGEAVPVSQVIIAHHDENGEVMYFSTIARDISVVKETEQALRESEDRFRQVIHNAPLVVYTTDEEGIFTMSEGRSLAKLGLEPGQVVGLSAYEIYKDFPDVVAGLEQALDGQTVFTPGVQVGDLYFDTTFAPLRNEEGEVTGVSGISVDVTDAVQAQEELEQQRDFLQHVLDINPNFIFVKNREGRFILANKALAEAYGTTVEGLVGMRDADFAQDPEEAEHFRQDDLAVLDSGEEKVVPEEPITEPDGTVRWLQTVKRPLVGPAGEETMLLGVAVDITERRLAEEHSQIQLEIGHALALAETEQDLVEVIAGAADLMGAATAVFLREEKGGRDELVLRAQNVPEEMDISTLPADTRMGTHELPSLFSSEGIFVSPDAQADDSLARPARRMARRMGATSWATLPLKAGNEWYGHLLVSAPGAGAFSEREINTYLAIAEQAGLAIRAARLYRETERTLERRTQEVALSTQIAQDISSATDLNDLYQRVVDQVQKQFGYYHTQLLRYDPALDTVALAFGYGEVGDEMQKLNHSVPMGVGIIGTAAATGESVLRPNIAEDSDWQPNSLLPYTAGELAVPIKLGDQVLGVLDVQSDQPNALGSNDQLLLEGLCGQIAVAIESTRLQQEMETNLRELTALQRYMIREGWDTYQEERLQTPGYQFDQGGIQPLELEKVPVREKNGRSAGNGDSQASTTNTPLRIRGETIGTIGIIDESEEALDPAEQDFLQSIAEQVAEALEVARLFEQTQRSLSEQERLTGELETVAQLSTVASTILEVEALLQQVTDLAKRSFDLYHAHIYLLDEGTGNLVLQAGAGNVGRLMTLEGHEIRLNAESIVARAARIEEPVIENDVRKSLDFLPNPFLPNTQSEMAVPLIVAENVIGVLDLQAEEKDRFSEEDMRIQTTLAAQIAVAIENARLYARQVETTAKLREVDQLKSEFLASMSHELRTPLNSIIGFADVLLEGLDGELNERMEEDVRLIRESGKHLRSLIGDILDMSKIEAGRMELRYEEVDVHQLAKDVSATAQPLVNEKGLELFTEIGDDVDVIEADRTRLRQVMWNIMGNAIKFTEEGSLTLKMEMEDPNHLLVSIRDTGIGIAPENLPIIFEQFRQVDGKLNRKAGGTGLGMPISKQLVELHGGEIGVDSILGEGSTFWFVLPRTREHASRPKTGPLSSPSD